MSLPFIIPNQTANASSKRLEPGTIAVQPREIAVQPETFSFETRTIALEPRAIALQTGAIALEPPQFVTNHLTQVIHFLERAFGQHLTQLAHATLNQFLSGFRLKELGKGKTNNRCSTGGVDHGATRPDENNGSANGTYSIAQDLRFFEEVADLKPLN